MKRQLFAEFYDKNLLFLDEFDDAIIGVTEVDGYYRVVYSTNEIMDMLQKTIDFEMALDHLNYNIRGAYMGPHTPLLVDVL